MATKVEKQQEMFSLIENWKKSGQGPQAFCKSKSLPYHLFHYWHKKYEAWHGSSGKSSKSEFISLNISPAISTPIFELVLGSGKRVSFYQQVDVSFVRCLLD